MLHIVRQNLEIAPKPREPLYLSPFRLTQPAVFVYFCAANPLYSINFLPIQMDSQKLQLQGLRVVRNEAWQRYAAVTNGERKAADGLLRIHQIQINRR